MEEWISQTLESPALGMAVLPAAFLLGLLGAVSSCCNFVAISAIAGYSGSLSDTGKRRHILYSGLFFMVGTVIALAALGAATGFISQAVGASMGAYWRFFAGFALILFGLASLNLLPFRLPKVRSTSGRTPGGAVRAMVYGLAIGGGATACSAACNPILPVTLGMAALKGRTVWGAAILAAFAIGYSLPLAGGLIGLGLGFGKLASTMQWLATAIKVTAGVLLIGAGFYLLATA